MRAKKMYGTDHDAHLGLKETPRMRPTYTTPRKPRYNAVQVIAVLAVVFVALAAMALSGFKDDALLLEQQQYCRMVHTHNTTDGAYGWPDYDNAYATSCNADGTAKEQ